LYYFRRMEKVIIGMPGEMKDTVEALLNHRKVVSISLGGSYLSLSSRARNAS
jgi:hypothetical protein